MSAPTLQEQRFRALGADCRVVVAGDDGLASEAVEVVADFESRWSRFRPSSDVSRLNDLSGRIVVLDPTTYHLVECAESCRRWTQGRFDPLMLSELEALGYRRDWRAGVQAPLERTARPCRGPIELFPAISAVALPAGTRFDPGGLGKGLIADHLAQRLRSAGATSVLVSLGGDLRVEGEPWLGDSWEVEIAGPQLRETSMGTITVASGAVATSSVVSRRWRIGDEIAHHILDPETGEPSTTDLLTATIVAESAMLAEVAAKSVLLCGAEGAAAEMERLGVHGVAVASDGAVIDSTGQRPGAPTWN